MASGLPPVQVDLITANKTGRGLSEAQKGLRSFATSATRAGIGMTATLTAPLALFQRQVMTTAIGASKSMAYMKANVEEVGVSLEDLQKQTIATASTNIKTVSEVAEMNKELGKGGMTSQAISTLMEPAVNLATVVEGETSEVAKTLQTINSLYPEITSSQQEAAKAMDMMAATITSSPQDFEDYAYAMQQTVGVAKNMKMTFKDLNQYVGVMSFFGIKGSNVGAQAKATMRVFTQPAKLAKLLGVSGTDKQGNLRSVGDVMGDVTASLYKPGVSEGERLTKLNDMFKRIGIRGAAAMTSDFAKPDGQSRWTQMLKSLDASEGTIQRMTDTILGDGLFGTFKRMTSAFDAMKVNVGMAQGGIIIPIMQKATDMFLAIGKAPVGVINGLTILMGAIAALGPVLLIAGTVANIVVAMSMAIPVLTTAFAPMLAMIAKVGFGGFIFTKLGIFFTILMKVVPVLAAIGAIFTVITAVRRNAKEIQRGIEDGSSPYDNLERALSITGDTAYTAAGAFGMLQDALESITDFISPVVDKYYEHKNKKVGTVLDAVDDLRMSGLPENQARIFEQVALNSKLRKGTMLGTVSPIFNEKWREQATALEMAQAAETYVATKAPKDITKGFQEGTPIGQIDGLTVNVYKEEGVGVSVKEENIKPTTTYQPLQMPQ